MKYSNLVDFKKNKTKWLKVIILVILSSIFYLRKVRHWRNGSDGRGFRKPRIYRVWRGGKQNAHYKSRNGGYIVNILIIGAILILTYILSSIIGAYTDYYIDSFSFETSNKVRNFVFKKILIYSHCQAVLFTQYFFFLFFWDI